MRGSTEGILAIGVLGLATFPVLGNALALLWAIPRRTVQGALAAVVAGVLVYAWYRLPDRPEILRPSWWMLGSLLPPLLMVAGLAGSAASGVRPAGYAIAAAIASVLWVWAATLYLFVFVSALMRRRRESAAARTAGSSSWFGRCLFTLVLLLTLIAYLMGPAPGDGYMAFGGSTTTAGVTAAILGALTLLTLTGLARLIAFVCSLYLCFVATSRAGVLLLLILFLAVLGSRLLGGKPPRRRTATVVQHVLLVAVGTILVVAPASLNTYYPYLSSRPGDAGARVDHRDIKLNDWQALMLRYQRLVRLVGASLVLPGLDGLVAQGPQGIFEDWQPADRPVAVLNPVSDGGRGSSVGALATRPAGILEDRQPADSRWQLLIRSAMVVGEAPWGYWPQPFEQVARIQCGRPPICEYPHNLLLEIGFHFGWVSLALVTLGLLAGGVLALRALTQGPESIRVTAASFLGYALLAQLSGNLVDHLIPWTLGLIWMTRHWASVAPLESLEREDARWRQA